MTAPRDKQPPTREELARQLALEQEADPEVDLLLDIDTASADWLRRSPAPRSPESSP